MQQIFSCKFCSKVERLILHLSLTCRVPVMKCSRIALKSSSVSTFVVLAEDILQWRESSLDNRNWGQQGKTRNSFMLWNTILLRQWQILQIRIVLFPEFLLLMHSRCTCLSTCLEHSTTWHPSLQTSRIGRTKTVCFQTVWKHSVSRNKVLHTRAFLQITQHRDR